MKPISGFKEEEVDEKCYNTYDIMYPGPDHGPYHLIDDPIITAEYFGPLLSDWCNCEECR